MFGKKIIKRLCVLALSLILSAGALSVPCFALGRISDETEDIPVTVRWQHGTNPEDQQPESVVLYLENGSTRISTLRLSRKDSQPDGSWTGVFKKIPVYAVGGSPVIYTLASEPVPLYVSEVKEQPSAAALSVTQWGDKITPASQSTYSIGTSQLIVANKGGSYYVWTEMLLSDKQQERLCRIINEAQLPGLGKSLSLSNTLFRAGLPAEFLNGQVAIRKTGETVSVEFGSTNAWSLFYAGNLSVRESRAAELLLRYAPNVSPETVTVSVKKLWSGDESIAHPDRAQVNLYRDGELFGDSVVLSEENNWSYSWEGLEAERSWTVDEPAPPPGYVKTVSRDGNSFTVTNILKTQDTPTPPGGVQTGDLAKPLTLCAFMLISLGLCCAGLILLRKNAPSGGKS